MEATPSKFSNVSVMSLMDMKTAIPAIQAQLMVLANCIEQFKKVKLDTKYMDELMRVLQEKSSDLAWEMYMRERPEYQKDHAEVSHLNESSRRQYNAMSLKDRQSEKGKALIWVVKPDTS